MGINCSELDQEWGVTEVFVSSEQSEPFPLSEVKSCELQLQSLEEKHLILIMNIWTNSDNHRLLFSCVSPQNQIHSHKTSLGTLSKPKLLTLWSRAAVACLH